MCVRLHVRANVCPPIFEIGITETLKHAAKTERPDSAVTSIERSLSRNNHKDMSVDEVLELIDRMRQGSIVGSVGPLHGPGRQRSHASAGQPDRPGRKGQAEGVRCQDLPGGIKPSRCTECWAMQTKG